jgi:hypothetical protein
MGLAVAYEKVGDIPIRPESISFGTISAAGISAFVASGRTVFSGSYSFDTVTLTLEGIIDPPYSRPGVNPGQDTFTFRNRTWHITDIQEGGTISIAGQSKYLTWSMTGVDLDNPKITVS